MRTQDRLKRICLFLLTSGTIIASGALAACAGEPAANVQPSEMPPTATAQQFPDLIAVTAWVEAPENRLCSDPNAAMKIHIIVKNQGEASAGEFIVSALNSQQRIAAGLSAGAEIDVQFSGYTPDFVAQIDPSGQVQESNEANNEYRAQLLLPTLPSECNPTPTPAVQTQSPIITLVGHNGKVLDIDFSPDGNLIASGSVDNTLRLWRVDQGTLLRTMQGHPFPITALKIAPSGAILATGSTDGIIRLWSVSNGLLGHSLQAHGGRVLDLQFSPDGSRLASSASDFTVRLWNPADGRLLRTIDEGMAQVNSLAYSPDGRLLAWVEADGSIKVWRISDGSWMLNLRNIYLPATQIAFSPDQSLLASGYSDGRIQFWKYPEGILVDTFEQHNGAITGLAFSPDGEWLASSSKDGDIFLWSVEKKPLNDDTSPSTLGPLVTLKELYLGHTGQVNKVHFSPKGDLLASCGDDGTIRLWSLPDK